jgi:hypothetical protein
MPKNFYDLIKEAEEFRLLEAEEVEEPEVEEPEDEDDIEEPKEETIDGATPEGKGEYDADDLREVIDYVYDLLDKEDDGEENDSVEEIGLDLIYEYADIMPDTLINQIVQDLKEMFEIEDTMLESALFVKSKKGVAAKAAKKKMTQFYKKNKKAIKSEAKSWRTSPQGKKIAKLHKKAFKGLCGKGKYLRTPLGMPELV